MARRAGVHLVALAAGGALVLALAVPAAGEVAQKNGLIVNFGGSIAPQVLPRTGTTPIGVTVAGRVRSADGGLPPALRRLSLELNGNGVLDRRGLPACRPGQLQSSSSRVALETCGAARVGGGRAAGWVVIPDQRPFLFHGRIIAFNGSADGEPTILAHLYSKTPIALTFVLVFTIQRTPGTYGTRLVAVVPPRTRRLVHLTSFRLHLSRDFEAAGEQRSYLSAGCPAPAGFTRISFPLVRTTLGFVGGTTLRSVITRTCRTRS